MAHQPGLRSTCSGMVKRGGKRGFALIPDNAGIERRRCGADALRTGAPGCAAFLATTITPPWRTCPADTDSLQSLNMSWFTRINWLLSLYTKMETPALAPLDPAKLSFEAVGTRRRIIASYWLVVLFFIPVWWNVTSIERLSLPVNKVAALDSQDVSELHTYTHAGETGLTILGS